MDLNFVTHRTWNDTQPIHHQIMNLWGHRLDFASLQVISEGVIVEHITSSPFHTSMVLFFSSFSFFFFSSSVFKNSQPPHTILLNLLLFLHTDDSVGMEYWCLFKGIVWYSGPHKSNNLLSSRGVGVVREYKLTWDGEGERLVHTRWPGSGKWNT